MSAPERRSIPDNLDPLVDTLSNVVGILVIVVALTQLQLGDALTRVARLDRLRGLQEREQASLPTAAERQADRRDALLLRSGGDLDEAAEMARTMLTRLSAPVSSSESDSDGDVRDLEARVDELKARLGEIRDIRDRRGLHRTHLARVPKTMVARLPDPQVVQGRESWILVRHGRVYLADRAALLDTGSQAIERILADAVGRVVRDDEFASVSRYLRKRDVGAGNFRWQLRTDPKVHVQLEWRSRDAGLGHTDLMSSSAFREWLAARSPETDFIRFHVWADSFEAYLAAREAVETNGFRAGWVGYEIDQEFELGLRFGARRAETGPVEVD